MTDMATIGDIVVDCDRPAFLARFWAAALDDYAVALTVLADPEGNEFCLIR